MPVIELARDGHVATLWLASPDRQNALGRDLFEELPAQMAAIDSDPEIRAVVLAARGKSFSVGLDLRGGLGEDFMTLLQGGLARDRRCLYEELKRLQRAFDSVAATDKPVIAAVHGWCVGGGLDLIAACDLRYATRDAKLSLREARMAMMADLGSLQRLPGILSMGALRELAFTGRDFDAEEGLRLGLFNGLFDSAEALLGGVRAKAEEIARCAPLAVQATKRALRQQDAERIARSLDDAALWNAAHLASEDLFEAFAAFAERRPPAFKGR